MIVVVKKHTVDVRLNFSAKRQVKYSEPPKHVDLQYFTTRDFKYLQKREWRIDAGFVSWNGKLHVMYT
jgi:hypothetical protein